MLLIYMKAFPNVRDVCFSRASLKYFDLNSGVSWAWADMKGSSFLGTRVPTGCLNVFDIDTINSIENGHL